jgi:hypothetical protein
LFSSLRSSLPQFGSGFRYRRSPSRLVLGVAAAIVAAGIGISVGLSASSGAPAGTAAGHTGLLSAATATGARGGASGAASSAAASSAAAKAAAAKAAAAKAAAAKAAAARHEAAVRQHRAAAGPASSQRTRRGGGGQHPATAAHVPPRRHRHVAAAAPAQPFLVYDSVTPQAIPGNPVVATYADGPNPDTPAMVAGRTNVIWISITGYDYNASALDIEPGCASPSQAASWVSGRLRLHPHGVAILYTMISDWSAVQANAASLPSWMKSHIRWWIADPTGTPHIVPGSQATQWYWGPNYDISTALPGF